MNAARFSRGNGGKKKKMEVESTLDYRQVENERRVPITYCSTQAA